MCGQEVWSKKTCRNGLDNLREERGHRTKRKGSFERNFERKGGDFSVDLCWAEIQ